MRFIMLPFTLSLILTGCRQSGPPAKPVEKQLVGAWQCDQALTQQLPVNRGKKLLVNTAHMYGQVMQERFGYTADGGMWSESKLRPRITGTYKVLSSQNDVLRIEGTVNGKSAESDYRILGPDTIAFTRSNDEEQIWIVAKRIPDQPSSSPAR